MENIPTIEINIMLDEKRVLKIAENSTVDELIEKVCETLLQNQNPETLKLNFTGKPLVYRGKKDGRPLTLADVHIVDKSLLYAVLILPGGIFFIVAAVVAGILGTAAIVKATKSTTSTAYVSNRQTNRGITRTTDPNYPKKISILDSSDPELWIMPCGHAIGREDMTYICQNLLTSPGAYKFICPSPKKENCRYEWDWFDVRGIAQLSDEERSSIEERFARNYLSIAAGVRKCPGCGLYCQRKNRRDVRLECIFCSKRNSELFTFCWYCQQEWIGNGVKCGNNNCDGRDERIRILENCSMKTVCGKTFPAQRACTKCGILIEHKDQCGHVVCTQCQNPFCFTCLRGQKENGEWICKYNEGCRLAPTQTSFPECE